MSDAVKTLQSWFYSLNEESKKEVLLFLYYKNNTKQALTDSVNLGPRANVTILARDGLNLGPAPSGLQTGKVCGSCGRPL